MQIESYTMPHLHVKLQFSKSFIYLHRATNTLKSMTFECTFIIKFSISVINISVRTTNGLPPVSHLLMMALIAAAVCSEP